MFHPFQKFLARAANKYGIARQLEAAKICQDFRTLTPAIFTKLPQASDHIQPATYQRKILVIKVPNPAWAQEVIMRKEKIIQEMNAKAGKTVIKNLRTQIGLFS